MPAYWIWLSQRKGIGNKQKLELAERFGGAYNLWQAQSYDVPLPAAAALSLGDKELTSAYKILEDCRRKGIAVLKADDEAYPRRLLAIADPPVVLYYKGRLPRFDEEAAVGVVGTRSASAYGLMAAERISGQIAAHGGLVISGMALGIDAQAGWGALRMGAPSVAVLGGGVDHIYPAQNRDLYQALAQNGCLISEYPPGTRPTSWTFPRRNRIVSGLSCAVLAVEAPEKSGTMITARLALEQGKPLYVVPGQINSAFCAGSNALLRDGARIATCGWDILREYEGVFPQKLHKTAAAPVAAPQPAPQPAPSVPAPVGATEDEQKLLSVLAKGECTVDDLIDASGVEAKKALATLTMLEIKGMVTNLPGRRVTLA